ncbi:hypothetical protein BDW02DRAFT_288859 [Decorospora gaudefroyi]|uniref:Uncharacterized protein n=1 Tax=Decorospora gaudefroyi TaxID=184978 RepID=A0A6A5KHK8_9PLEO|nr:hypothetical protein BDW02DRAFT_288859 [Decorospora gaudefroyi]
MTSSLISLTSLTSGDAAPTQTACFSNTAPNGINVTGLTGQVCQVNIPPNEANITSCCNDGAEVRILNDCTQWCETDGDEFFGCVNDLFDSPPEPYIGGLCRIVGEDESESPSASASSTSASGASTSVGTSTEAPSGTQSEGPSTTQSGDAAKDTTDPDGGAADNFGHYPLGLTVMAFATTLGFLYWL